MANILIVEDNSSLSRLYSRFFASSGHQVAHTGTCRETEQLLLDYLPDIVVLDMNLPDGSGMQIANSLREDSRFIKTSIVLISGAQPENNDEEMRRLGIAQFLHKPVSIPLLDAVVKRLVTSNKQFI